jgi:hypothetical protein
MENILQKKDYLKSEIEEMSTISIYFLMEEKGANVFGLWAADKSELIKAFEKQIGFRK